MKFIVMTKSAPGNNFVQELLASGLKPELIVTDNPFLVSNSNKINYPVKKIIRNLSFLKNRSQVKNKNQSYFQAKNHSIPILDSTEANSPTLEKFIKESNIDYIFTFIFKLLTKNIYTAPKKGCINFHPSLLPYNRGPSPWNWIILQGQKNTGITFHYIAKGIDSGQIVKQHYISVPEGINSSVFKEFIFGLGSIFFVKLIFEIEYDSLPLPVENKIEEGTYEQHFSNDFTMISENNSFKEIGAIIDASRDGYRNAYYQYQDRKLNIINYTEIVNKELFQIKLPHIDKFNNLLINTADRKIILLVTSG